MFFNNSLIFFIYLRIQFYNTIFPQTIFYFKFRNAKQVIQLFIKQYFYNLLRFADLLYIHCNPNITLILSQTTNTSQLNFYIDVDVGPLFLIKQYISITIIINVYVIKTNNNTYLTYNLFKMSNKICFMIIRKNGDYCPLYITPNNYQAEFLTYISNNKIQLEEADSIKQAVQIKIKELSTSLRSEEQKIVTKKFDYNNYSFDQQIHPYEQIDAVNVKRKYMLLSNYEKEKQVKKRKSQSESVNIGQKSYASPTKNWKNKKQGDKNLKYQKQVQQYERFLHNKYGRGISQESFKKLHQTKTISFQNKKNPQKNYQQQDYQQYLKIQQELNKKNKVKRIMNQNLTGSKCQFKEIMAEQEKQKLSLKEKEKIIRQRMKKSNIQNKNKVKHINQYCVICSVKQNSPIKPRTPQKSKSPKSTLSKQVDTQKFKFKTIHKNNSTLHSISKNLSSTYCQFEDSIKKTMI